MSDIPPVVPPSDPYKSFGSAPLTSPNRKSLTTPERAEKANDPNILKDRQFTVFKNKTFIDDSLFGRIYNKIHEILVGKEVSTQGKEKTIPPLLPNKDTEFNLGDLFQNENFSVVFTGTGDLDNPVSGTKSFYRDIPDDEGGLISELVKEEVYKYGDLNQTRDFPVLLDASNVENETTAKYFDENPDVQFAMIAFSKGQGEVSWVLLKSGEMKFSDGRTLQNMTLIDGKIDTTNQDVILFDPNYPNLLWHGQVDEKGQPQEFKGYYQ